MLKHLLRYPTQKVNPFARSTLNPYLTIILTFLATVCKQDKVWNVLERSIRWEKLAKFLETVPRGVMMSQGLNISGSQKSGAGTQNRSDG